MVLGVWMQQYRVIIVPRGMCLVSTGLTNSIFIQHNTNQLHIIQMCTPITTNLQLSQPVQTDAILGKRTISFSIDI